MTDKEQDLRAAIVLLASKLLKDESIPQKYKEQLKGLSVNDVDYVEFANKVIMLALAKIEMGAQ